jgi:2-polyprenyl-3-methyl-5-hydroxy-6-metoxy-1,4-benzoquinol methylase
MSDENGAKTAELAAIVREIRDRVRAATPGGQAGALGVPLPDLLPLLHARDAAEGRAAAIGTVNPRPPGLVNNVIQSAKRTIARSLNWMVRDQVDFNHAAVECVQAALDAMNESNRVLAALASDLEKARAEASALRQAHTEWQDWRRDWELRLSQAEVRLLRSVGELSTAYEHHTRELARHTRSQFSEQHAAFAAESVRAAKDIQTSLRADFEKVRREYEAMIHQELRVLRQRSAGAAPQATPAPAEHPGLSAPKFDYTRFADRFRGSEENVRERQQFYAPYFAGRRNVLDIGCGRGEFLDMARAHGAQAKGIDLDAESVEYCRSKGHAAEVADLFVYLAGLPDASLDGIFSSQVIEHLPPEMLPEMIRLCAAKLGREGVIALETPNPECLAIFATHFYIDPTHTRPVPPVLAAFYLEEAGFGGLEIRRLSPAADTMPSLASLPEDFRNAFFGGLDYTAIARKL